MYSCFLLFLIKTACWSTKNIQMTVTSLYISPQCTKMCMCLYGWQSHPSKGCWLTLLNHNYYSEDKGLTVLSIGDSTPSSLPQEAFAITCSLASSAGLMSMNSSRNDSVCGKKMLMKKWSGGKFCSWTDQNGRVKITALFALLNLLLLIFHKIMDTFVHIVYSSLEFLTCL